MIYQKQKIGKLGEKIAKNYLKKKGYKIIDEHYCLRGGEIDLIAQKEKSLIFIEVKTRTSNAFGWPEESVNYFKQKNLVRAISYYLFNNKIKETDYQFDIISIILNQGQKKALIKHFKNFELNLTL